MSEGHPNTTRLLEQQPGFSVPNGKQPGDPKKAARAIVRLTQEQKPRLRLLLRSNAYNKADKNDVARLEQATAWKELSLSTDF